MKEKFLKDLRSALEAEGLHNIDEALELYSSRFDLGHEAGMSDEEIVDMLGSVEDIVAGYTQKETLKNRYSITLELAVFSDFEIVRSNNPGVEFDIEKKALDYVKIIRNENQISLKSVKSKNGSMFMRNGRFDGRMYIGEDVEIESLVIDNCSSDLKVDSLSGKIFVLSNKSGGDIRFNDIEAKEKVIINNVSGDSKFNKVVSPLFMLNTVSGDTVIQEFVCDQAKMSIVSGDVTIHHSNDASYVVSCVSGDFKIKNEIDVEKIKFSSLSGDCYVGGRPLRKSFTAQIHDTFKNMKF